MCVLFYLALFGKRDRESSKEKQDESNTALKSTLEEGEEGTIPHFFLKGKKKLTVQGHPIPFFTSL